MLGDGKCGLDLERAGYSAQSAAGPGSAGVRIAAAGLGDFAEGWFAHGTLSWLSGANAGASGAVAM